MGKVIAISTLPCASCVKVGGGRREQGSLFDSLIDFIKTEQKYATDACRITEFWLCHGCQESLAVSGTWSILQCHTCQQEQLVWIVGWVTGWLDLHIGDLWRPPAGDDIQVCCSVFIPGQSKQRKAKCPLTSVETLFDTTADKGCLIFYPQDNPLRQVKLRKQVPSKVTQWASQLRISTWVWLVHVYHFHQWAQ